MEKTAFIFPGQGSQFVGMGKDFYDEYSSVREIYQNANDILGYDISKLSFEGPEQELKQTRVTQPALFVHSCVVTKVLREFDIYPQMAAGHSLGEYSALVASGVLEFQEGLRLVKLRGELMQKAGEQNSGTMAAIIGLEYDLVENLCSQVNGNGIVQPANFNSPIQVVISGTVGGVHKVIDLAKAAGAKRAVELDVSGAFHSPLMAPAQKKLLQALDGIKFKSPQIPVYCNVNAQAVAKVDEIRDLLAKQITNPVLWDKTIKNMITNGATQFIEVGAGNVLTGLLRRIDRNVQGKAMGTLNALTNLMTN